MKNSFWHKINKPILALAPMAGYSDIVFRKIVKDYGADVLYSEMASATAIYYQKDKLNKTLKLLKKSRKDKYYVVQLFGSNPEHFKKAVSVVSKEIKPDGIDINCGCPVSKIIKQGAGSDLMKNPKRAREIIKASLSSTNLPISIKIRTEVKGVKAEDFLNYLKDLDIKAIMIHGRSLAQGFSGPIDFNLIRKIKENTAKIVLANGGINNLKIAKETLKKTKADGLGLARGVLTRPWLFEEIKKNKEINLKREEIFSLILKHIKMVEAEFGKEGTIAMRKHLCLYVLGLKNASYLRERLVKTSSSLDVKKILCNF